MTITEITYERVHNLGDYESERVGVRVALNEGEKPDDAMELAKEFVAHHFSEPNPEPQFDIIAGQEGA